MRPLSNETNANATRNCQLFIDIGTYVSQLFLINTVPQQVYTFNGNDNLLDIKIAKISQFNYTICDA